MKKYILTVFTIFLSIFNFAQIDNDKATNLLQEADSLLKKEVNKAISLAFRVFNASDKNLPVKIKSSLILEKAYLAKKKYDSALIYTKIGLEKSLIVKDTLNIIMFYSNKGIDAYFKSDFKNALIDLNKARYFYENLINQKIKKQISKEKYAKILNNIASTYLKTIQLDSAIVYMHKSIKIKENLNVSQRTLAVSKMNLGGIYIKVESYEKAKVCINNALEKVIKLKDSALISTCYTNLGILYKNLKDTTKAIESYHKSLAIKKKIKDLKGEAIVSQNLADLYTDQKKIKKATFFYNQAIKIKQKTNANTASARQGIGRLFLEQKKYDSAIYHSELALKDAKTNKQRDVVLNALEILYQAYKKKRNNKIAFNYLEQYTLLKDDILNVEKQKTIEELNAKFESNQKQKEISYLKKINSIELLKTRAIQSRQKIINLFSVLVFALILILTYYFIEKKKKEKNILVFELQNEELKNKEFQKDIEYKTKQLTTHALNMMQKNKIIAEVKNEIKAVVKNPNVNITKELNAIINHIDISQKSSKDWELFKKYFEKVNKNFNSKLKAINPNLNTYDYRLAALVSLNLNIKETASLLSISPNSVKIARHRLRTRLKIQKGVDLYSFLNDL